jgi:hypothetical protein
LVKDFWINYSDSYAFGYLAPDQPFSDAYISKHQRFGPLLEAQSEDVDSPNYNYPLEEDDLVVVDDE